MRELRELSIFELKEKCKVLGLKGYQNLRTNRTLIEKIKKHFVPLSVDKIKEKYYENQKVWTAPDQQVICEGCGATNKISIDLDQSSFFGNA